VAPCFGQQKMSDNSECAAYSRNGVKGGERKGLGWSTFSVTQQTGE